MASTKYRKKENAENTEEKKPKKSPKSQEPAIEESRAAITIPMADDRQLDFLAEGEELLDSIKIEDEKNVIEIFLIKKPNRLTKVSFRMNGIDIRPHTYSGNNAGSSYFDLLKMTQKKG